MTTTTEGPPRGAPRTMPAAESRADFDAVYAAQYADLTVQLYAYFGDRQEAQDVVQEAFCRALRRWSTVSRYDDPVAWVRKVAWNLAISRWRRSRTAWRYLARQRAEYAPEPGPDRVVLRAALARLPFNQRRAVTLFYLADLSVADIAQECGVPDSTVRSWLHRARAALLEQLRDPAEEASRGSVR